MNISNAENYFHGIDQRWSTEGHIVFRDGSSLIYDKDNEIWELDNSGRNENIIVEIRTKYKSKDCPKCGRINFVGYCVKCEYYF